jgi:hypothetical protein
MMKRLLVVIAVALALGACETVTDTPSSTSDGLSFEVTAEDVVDFMASAQIKTFCTAYVQLDDYDLALAQFTDGYGTSQDPSAVEVFDELLGRC